MHVIILLRKLANPIIVYSVLINHRFVPFEKRNVVCLSTDSTNAIGLCRLDSIYYEVSSQLSNWLHGLSGQQPWHTPSPKA